MNNTKYGLVFAGGGTKGAYQVGALKALKEMHIKIGAVSGASIGSINGALFVQGDLKLLEDLYHNIEMKDIMEISEKNKLNVSKNLLSPDNILKIANEYIRNKGISNEPLRKLLNKYINLDKIYKSKIDFGIRTYDVKNEEGIELFKKDIPKDKMIDYILASSCFPIFKPQKIGGNVYLDGGLYDNMPINMLINKGYKNIILIDINGIGMIRRTMGDDVYFKVIKPTEDLGGTFEFNKEKIDHNINLGYLDTLKAFRVLMGKHFYFEKIEYFKLLTRYSIDDILGLEEAGLIYKLNRYKRWKAKDFINAIISAYNKEISEFPSIKDINVTNISNYIKEGYGISICREITNNYPALLNKYNGVFSNYFMANNAIEEVLNQRKDKLFYL